MKRKHNLKQNLKQTHSLAAFVQSSLASSLGCWQGEHFPWGLVRTRSCHAPILSAAFAAEGVRCQCLLTPSLHPAVSQHQMLAALGVSASATVNPCSSTGYKSSSEKHQLETCPWKSLGVEQALAAPPWPVTHKGLILPGSRVRLYSSESINGFGACGSWSLLFILGVQGLLHP